MDEAVKLPFLDVPAQTALFYGLNHVPPLESVLRLVAGEEAVEDGAGLLFCEHGLGFIGGAVNFLGGPQERDFVGPVAGEQMFSSAMTPQRGTQILQQFVDELVHAVNLVMVQASPSMGLIARRSGSRFSTS